MRAWMMICGLVIACSPGPERARKTVANLAVRHPEPNFRVDSRLIERDGSGEMVYLGLDLDPPDPRPGQPVTLTHYWRNERASRQAATVIVRGAVGSRTFLKNTHAPLYGRLPTTAWKPGDQWMDHHVVHLPKDLPNGTVKLFVGLRSGDMVWTAQTLPGQQDGRDHLLAARFSVEGRTKPVDDLPVARIVRTDSPIVPDGELDEPGWKRAPVLEFADSMGRNIVIRHRTRLRLLYDDQNLYVAFEADDTDITERYKNRDDPIYEHETVELFVMPNVTAPNTGPYVELQASPTGVIFDASFDGPRRGMNKRYGAGQKVGTAVDGTLNDERPDRGWVSEWVVPFKNIRGVQKPPAAGTEWRMNAFRIEKYRRGGRQIGEFSAWSPPRVGDFHHVARFGRMRFEGPPSP